MGDGIGGRLGKTGLIRGENGSRDARRRRRVTSTGGGGEGG